MMDDGAGQDGSERGISAADEQALSHLFASLVADASPSEVSPLDVVELGRIEQRRALDVRTRRFRVTRNVLVAAVLAAMVVLIVPRLVAKSSSTAAAHNSSSSAAAVSSSSQPQAGAAAAASAPAGSAGSGSAGSGGAASGSAASGSTAGSEAASVGGTSAAAASGAMSSAAMSSAAAAPDAGGDDLSKSSGGPSSASAPRPAPAGSGSAAADECPPLPGKALAAFRSAFPAGYYGLALTSSRAAPCSLFESVLPVVAGRSALSVTVRRAAVGACRQVCQPEPGQSGVYFGDTSAGGPGNLVVAPVYVYADGYEISVFIRGTGSNPTAPSFGQLVAGARAVTTSLG